MNSLHAHKLKRAAALAAVAAATSMVTVAPAHAAAGALDASFGSGGKQILPISATPSGFAAQPDGKVIVGDERTFKLTRLDAGGSLDGSFAGDGITGADFGGTGGISTIAIQPDGKIVAAGHVELPGGGYKVGVARFSPTGALDPTFDPGGADGDGKKLYTPNGPYSANALVIRPDGHMVIAGGNSIGLMVTGLSPTGAEEDLNSEAATFDGGEVVSDAAIAPDGTIVVAGSVTPQAGGDRDMVVARFKPDGKLDKTLGGTGTVRTGPGNGDDHATKVLVQPDGKIVLAGSTGPAEQKMIVTRLAADGKLDSAFGEGGSSTPDFPGEDAAAGAALLPDGKIVIAGTAYPNHRFAAARLDSGGALDPSFGDGGKATVAFDSLAIANSAGIDSQGRVVFAGWTAVNNNTESRFAAARLLADPPPGDGSGPAEGPADGGGTGPITQQPETQTPPPPRLRCAGKAATIVGTAKRDRIRGTKRADVIVALGGNDVISGLNGNDVICGGTGNDTISGGRGRDVLRGEAGRDKLVGGPGRDKLVGGTGRDRVKQ